MARKKKNTCYKLEIVQLIPMLKKREKKSGVPCMPYFGTVSSLLQSVDSHCLWGGLADGLPSTLGSARSRFERDRTSLRCPPYAALTSV